jgi:hypothetical protein
MISLASCLDETKVDPATPATFVRYINGGNADEPKALEKTKDGGYIILANTIDPAGYRIKLVKVDQYGTVLWTSLLPATRAAGIGYKGNSISVLDDGSGYIITGELINGTKTDLLILQTDAEGLEPNEGKVAPAPIALTETDKLGSTPDDVHVSGRASWILHRDTLLVLGSVTGISKNMVLAKIHYPFLGNANLIWDNPHGTGTSTLINKLFLQDKDLIFGGTIVQQGGNDFTDVRIVRALQNSERTEYDIPYGDPELSEQANGMCKTTNGYALIGSTNISRGDREIQLTRIDQFGGVLTSTTIPVFFPDTEDEVELDEEGNSLYATTDNGLIILATITSATSGENFIGRGEKDYYLIKSSSFGDVEWAQAFGSKRNDIGVAVLEADDGGYVILGQTSLANVPTIALIKTNSLGVIE